MLKLNFSLYLVLFWEICEFWQILVSSSTSEVSLLICCYDFVFCVYLFWLINYCTCACTYKSDCANFWFISNIVYINYCFYSNNFYLHYLIYLFYSSCFLIIYYLSNNFYFSSSIYFCLNHTKLSSRLENCFWESIV